MSMGAQPLTGPGWRPNAYRPNPRTRLYGIAAVLLVHGLFFVILLWRGAGLSDQAGSGGAGVGDVSVFELHPIERSASKPRQGGGSDNRRVVPSQARVALEIEDEKAGSGDFEGQGAARLGDELAQLLADDPVAGGGRADYETILRRHIVAHSRPLSDRERRKETGTVMVRFRVARDGQIVDARVVRSRSAYLDEAALATLWRSEPLPRVPDSLDAPLEVDVPIDFLMRG